MNEIFYYGGLVFAAFFFILSIVLFITQKIPSSIGYYLHFKKTKPVKAQHAKRENAKNKMAVDDNATEILEQADETELLYQGGGTNIIAGNKTNVLAGSNKK